MKTTHNDILLRDPHFIDHSMWYIQLYICTVSALVFNQLDLEPHAHSLEIITSNKSSTKRVLLFEVVGRRWWSFGIRGAQYTL